MRQQKHMRALMKNRISPNNGQRAMRSILNSILGGMIVIFTDKSTTFRFTSRLTSVINKSINY